MAISMHDLREQTAGRPLNSDGKPAHMSPLEEEEEDEILSEPLLYYLSRYVAQWYHLFAICLNGLAWKWTQKLSFFDQFIAHQRQSIDKTKPGEWWYSTRSVWLAQAYWQRYFISRDLKDVDNAINVLRNPVLLVPGVHANNTSSVHAFLHLLLQVLHWLIPRRIRPILKKFFRYQQSQFITRRIFSILQFLRHRKYSNENDTVASRLLFLAAMYGMSFNLQGGTTALDDRIIYHRRAIALLQDGRKNISHVWKLLAVDFLRRWRIRSDPNDLRDALAASQKALDNARAVSDPTLEAQALTAYGECMQVQTAITGRTLEELAEIVAVRRLALECLPICHRERPMFKVYLGNALIDFGKADFWSDENRIFPVAFEEALLCFEDALASLEQLHLILSSQDAKSMRESILIEQANFYINRHPITALLHQRSDDALKALSILDSLDVDSTESVLVPHWLQQNYKLARMESLEQTAHYIDAEREKVIRCYRKLATDPGLSPKTRLYVADRWLFSASSFRHVSVQEAAEASMELSTHLVGLAANATEQILHLNPKIRNNTIKKSLDYSLRPRENLTQVERDMHLALIESSLSLFWSARLKTVHSFDEVARYNPDLKAELEDISAFLNRYSDSPRQNNSDSTNIDVEEERGRVYKAREKFETLLHRARQIQGLKNFLKPRPFHELCQAADKGHIIVLSAATSGNFTDSLTDVFVLKPHHSSVQHIELQPGVYGLEHTVVRSLCEDWARLSRMTVNLSARDARHGRRLVDSKVNEDELFRDFLRRLWKLIVNPILTALDLKKRREDGTLPRVWWLPTGLVASLPFHAAGIYGIDIEECAFNYVVSSYIHSINALMDARKAYKARTASRQLFLAVAVPNAPDHQMLPNAVVETSIIKNRMADPSRIIVLEGSSASKAAIVAQLPHAHWLHFACHALQEDTSVLGSHLVLADGKLTLEEIMQFDLNQAEFAMLSACQTCSGDGTLTDDALHLAGGLIAAGFKSVIATRYPMQDADGPDMAKMVYGRLLQGEEWDVEASAPALHDALQSMRKRVPFRRWLPYVHIGI